MSITVPVGVRGQGPDPAPRPTDLAPAVVYLAAAQGTYGTTRYREALRQVTGVWPRAVLMDADTCGFASRADWNLRWPFICDGIDCMVVLTETDGTVSQETWLELRDATDAALPCWFVSTGGALVHARSVRIRLHGAGVRTARRWALAEVLPAPRAGASTSTTPDDYGAD
ncbi:MAG TPA: hypothetical protein VLZ77_17420, partial [Acidimicrobiales bacterium]|nr:hypothetical protein [Acidimicrobiales bacterium]